MKLHGNLIALALCAVMFGCSSRHPEWPEVHPVHGKLTIGGKPAAGAYIALHARNNPAIEKYHPYRVADKDGIFRLSTFYQGDGAPVGEFAVTVIWPTPPKPGDDEDEEGPDRLKGRYANPKQPATLVTIAQDTEKVNVSL